MDLTKQTLKSMLQELSKCGIQHTGYPCGTCFFSISKKLTNEDWQLTLYLRGDYKKKELNNLPSNINEGIWNLMYKLSKAGIETFK